MFVAVSSVIVVWIACLVDRPCPWTISWMLSQGDLEMFMPAALLVHELLAKVVFFYPRTDPILTHDCNDQKVKKGRSSYRGLICQSYSRTVLQAHHLASSYVSRNYMKMYGISTLVHTTIHGSTNSVSASASKLPFERRIAQGKLGKLDQEDHSELLL